MKVLIASSICPQALAEMRRVHDVQCACNVGPDQLRAAIVDREVVVFRSGVELSGALMARAPRLRLLVRAGSGLDNLDLDYVGRRGITLVRIPGPGAQAVAELAFGLMLTLARQIRVADEQLRRGHWTKHQVDGYLLQGKTLGIVGAGNIGSRVGRMGAAWEMDVVGCVEHPTAGVAAELRANGIRLAPLDDVLETADFLSIHVPLQASTRGLIDAAALARMKPGSFLVNLSRGGVVDEAALRSALTRPGGLGGAGLDVHEREGEGQISQLADLPNVVLTPHIGAMTHDSQRQIGRRVLEILDDFCGQGSVPALQAGS